MRKEKMKNVKGLALLLAGVMIAATGCTTDVNVNNSTESSSSVKESTVQVQRSTATVLSQEEFVSTFESRGSLETYQENCRVINVDKQSSNFYYRDVTNETIMENLGQSTFIAEYEGMRTVTEADLKDLSNTVDTEVTVMKNAKLVEQGENFYIYNSSVEYEESSEHYSCESVFVKQNGKIYEIEGMSKDITEISFQKTMNEIVSVEVPVISGKEFEDIMSEYGEVEPDDSDLFDYQISTDDFNIVYGKDIISVDQLKLIGTDEFLSVIKSVIKTDKFSLSNIDLKALGSNFYHYSATQLESDDIKVPCDIYFFVENGKINVIMGDDHGKDSVEYKEALAQATGLTV